MQYPPSKPCVWYLCFAHSSPPKGNAKVEVLPPTTKTETDMRICDTRLASIAALAMAWLSPSLSAQEKPDTLSLDMARAIEIAYKQNANVTTSDMEVTRATYNQRKGLSALLPNVNLSGSYGYTLKKQRVYFGGGDDSSNPFASAFPKEGIEMGQTHNIQAGVQAGVAVLAPQLWASLALDRNAVEQAVEKARASRVEMTSEVRKAYLGALMARDALRVLEESLANAQENHGQIRQKFEQGLVAEYDLIRMDAQVKNLVTEVIRAQQSVRLAEMKLKVLMNIDPDHPIKLKEQLEDYNHVVYGRLLSDDTPLSLEQNSALRTLDLQGDQLEKIIKVKKMAYAPTLSLSFSYNYSFASDQFKLDNNRRWSPHSMIGVSLNIPVFSGGSRYYDLKATRLQLQQLALQRRQTEKELNLGLTNSRSEQRNAASQFVASQEAVRSAQKGYDIAQARYRTGAGTILELNDADLALRQAQLNLNQSIFNYMVASYTLDQLEGRIYMKSNKQQ